MAFFEDLSPYAYFHPEPDPSGTVNVGWLDWSHPIPVGDTPELFRAKLRRLCERRTKRTTGQYLCPFCWGTERPTSWTELRVPGRGERVYASPSIVHHYVDVHRYKPPQEFIDAVMACDDGEET